MTIHGISWRLPLAAIALATLSSCAVTLDDPGLLDDDEATPGKYDTLATAGVNRETLRLPNTLGGAASSQPANLAPTPGGMPSTAPPAMQALDCANGPAMPASCAIPVEQIMGGDSCGGAGCHGSPEEAAVAFVDLGHDTTDLAQRLSQTGGFGECEPFKIIDVDNPSMSLLITKLDAAPPCGQPMPTGGKTISPENKQCIIDWVMAQATCLAQGAQ